MRSRSLLLVLCGTLAMLAPAYRTPAAARPLSFDDFARIVRVSDPQIAPDGKRIAIVVSRPDMKKDTTANELVLVDVATGKHRSLTKTREHVNSPRWSPDGTQLAFIAPASGDPKAKSEVWIFPMNGGDANVATTAANGVDAYAWRPDGKAIAYSSVDDAKDKAAIEKKRDLFVVGDQDFLSQAAPVATHVWLQKLGNGKPARLTSGAWSLSRFSDLSWSADGKYLAFTRLPDAFQGHIGRSRATVLDVSTGALHDVTTGAMWSAGPVFAPTGERVAFAGATENLWAFQNNVGIADMAKPGNLFPATTLDRDISWMQWMPDGKAMYWAADDHTGVALWRIDLDAPKHERIDLGALQFAGEGSTARDGALAFTASTQREPSELYYLAPNASAPKKLTDYNAAIAALDQGASKEFTWTNDGFTEDGALTYPVGYVAGKKYPLVLEIHGGPTQSASKTGFSAFVQVLAAHGYFILQPNYRGSDNLGLAYAKALRGDVDPGPGSDIVAGVKALEATGEIDSSRIGVSGWSGGGLLTSWLIGHYPIWKAAVSGAAVNDFVEEYDLSDVYDYMPSLMGDISPWTAAGRKKYEEFSPINYAANVTAPTLILSDTGDYRVPSVQAYAFYRALKEQGKTVEFDAIPAYGHFPSDPVRQLEVYKHWANWLNKYLSP